jgi:hypothetical protein
MVRRSNPTAPDIPGHVKNDGWFDNVGDGPVSAVIVVRLTLWAWLHAAFSKALLPP